LLTKEVTQVVKTVRSILANINLLHHGQPPLKRQAGQGMVEYALILVLIAVVVIVILTVVGKQVNNVFSNISCGLAQCNP
jgi:pilus assembly protein Flp/PilA